MVGKASEDESHLAEDLTLYQQVEFARGYNMRCPWLAHSESLDHGNSDSQLPGRCDVETC